MPVIDSMVEEEQPKEVEPLYKSVNECFESISLKGIENGYANDIEARLLDLQNKYPVDGISVTARANQSAFGYNKCGVSGVKEKGVQCGLFKHNINYSNTLMPDRDKSIKTHSRTYSARGSKLVNDILGLTTIDHEYAHAIDDKYLLAINKDLKAFADKYATKKPITGNKEIFEINKFNEELYSSNQKLCHVIWNKLRDDMGLSELEFTRVVRKELGTYAIESKMEFLAEGFSNMRNLPQEEHSDFLKAFNKAFDYEFNRVLGGKHGEQ